MQHFDWGKRRYGWCSMLSLYLCDKNPWSSIKIPQITRAIVGEKFTKRKKSLLKNSLLQKKPDLLTMQKPLNLVRWYSKKFSLKRTVPSTTKLSSSGDTSRSIHPNSPARTRFAPSPTGYLHLGSLRTALYNYLLAKNTGGQFLLRLEDTDQTRLVPGAEQNIYETLKWCGLKIDEGPVEGGPYGPYRQSDRMDIYKKYAQILIDKGLAYYCSCSKERLLSLRESATKLKPPTTVTYDRKCYYDATPVESHSVIRFKSPDVYEEFTDLLHGKLNLQPQYNYNDRRYDDIVIMKSDGLPTYHFANVVDDHLMKITHVIRGEEWLPSTPKHIALYRAFGWEPPSYVHIPLLTSLSDKKLSKRSGDIGILSMKENGILPESIVNFVSLFGWSPPRDTPGVKVEETMTLEEIVKSFSLENLTKGNAKVNDSKLFFFNKFHLGERIKNPQKLDQLVDEYFPQFDEFTHGKYDKPYLKKLVTTVGPSLSNINELRSVCSYLLFDVDYSTIKPPSAASALIISKLNDLPFDTFNENVKAIMKEIPDISKKDIFQATRFALAGNVAGLTIPVLIDLLGEKEYRNRLQKSINYINQ